VKDTASHQKDTSTGMKDTTIHVQGVDIQVKGNNIHVKDTADAPSGDSATARGPNAPKDSPSDSKASSKDVAATDTPAQPKDNPAKDTSLNEGASTRRDVDRRWFISPLLKFQFQDFAFLEKNRKGYLSDANTLPFMKRGNGSFAASAYKNLTGRLSFSADIGVSFGHVTNDNTLISQTQSKTYNLLNATIYYHLLSAAYRIQPYVSIGINDIINDASYASAPIGIGAKFNSKKIMVMGQITYGYAVSKNISNSTMYGLGIYIPIKSKKQKQLEEEDKSPYNRQQKDKKKDNDSTKNGSVVNNIYITIKMDSLLKARGLDGNDGSNGSNGSGRSRRKGNGEDGDASGDEETDGGGSGTGSGGHSGRKKSALKAFNFDDFDPADYKVDTINGEPVIRFVVYFEFNEYSLNSKAFSSVDKVLGHLRNKPNLYIEIKGYTDNVGTEQYNNFLSRRRAKMVLDYMNSRGVPGEFMKAKAYGSDNPVGDNSDPNQAWLNRRAEIIVHEK
jgi:outer membrane protein OmpA-like peptidoglycan-associated protein